MGERGTAYGWVGERLLESQLVLATEVGCHSSSSLSSPSPALKRVRCPCPACMNGDPERAFKISHAQASCPEPRPSLAVANTLTTQPQSIPMALYTTHNNQSLSLSSVQPEDIWTLKIVVLERLFFELSHCLAGGGGFMLKSPANRCSLWIDLSYTTAVVGILCLCGSMH